MLLRRMSIALYDDNLVIADLSNETALYGLTHDLHIITLVGYDNSLLLIYRPIGALINHGMSQAHGWLPPRWNMML